MIKLSVIFLAGLLIIYSCKTTEKAGNIPLPADPVMDDAFRKPVNDKDLFNMTREAVPLDTAFIAGDTLHLLTKKMQACQTDNFKLLWNGMFLKSLPAQANLKLLLIAEPSCKEQHSFHLLYNLSPLHSKQDSFLMDRSIVIHVGPWSKNVRYNF